MTVRSLGILAVAVWMVGSGPAGAQQKPVTKANVVTVNATIQAIDQTARAVTIRDDAGNEDTLDVSQDMPRFNELKVGQKVNLTFYESIVFQLVKPGEKASGTSFEAALNRAKSTLPAGSVATQDKMTVTVKAVDPAVPSITVATEAGRVVTRKIEDKNLLTNVKPGDRIDITYTRAMLANVQNAK